MLRDLQRNGDRGATEMVVPIKNRGTVVSITTYDRKGNPKTHDLDVRAKKALDRYLRDEGIETDTTPTGPETVPTTPRP